MLINRCRPSLLDAPGVSTQGHSTQVTVQKGDTLTAIAKRAGVPVADLIAANPGIKNPDLIYPGQVVTVPARAREPAARPTPTIQPLPNQTPAPRLVDAQRGGAPRSIPPPAVGRGAIEGRLPRAKPAEVGAPATPAPTGPAQVSVPWISQYDGSKVPRAGDSACYRACREMARAAGGNPGASISNRFQVATGEDSKGRVTVDPEQARRANAYVDAELAAGRPVVVGVSHKGGDAPNSDGITDHFVTITGKGVDENGRMYYTYHDPATRHASVGSDQNPANRLYVGEDGRLVKQGQSASGYVVDRHFEVSMVIRNEP